MNFEKKINELKIILPELGLSRRASIWSKDDFPDPEGPIKATNSPGLILKFTFSKTLIGPFLFSKDFFIFSTCIKYLFIF